MGNKLLLLLVAATGLSAQVAVMVSRVDPAETRRDFGWRLAKVIVQHGVFFENQSAGAVSIAPTAVMRKIGRLRPITDTRMMLLIDDAEKNSGWARAGRGVGDVGRIGAFLTAADTIKIKERWPLAAFTAADAIIPYIIDRLRGAAVPVRQNYSRVAWIAPVQIGPGESGSAVIFTALDSKESLSFVLDMNNAPVRRMIQ